MLLCVIMRPTPTTETKEKMTPRCHRSHRNLHLHRWWWRRKQTSRSEISITGWSMPPDHNATTNAPGGERRRGGSSRWRGLTDPGLAGRAERALLCPPGWDWALHRSRRGHPKDTQEFGLGSAASCPIRDPNVRSGVARTTGVGRQVAGPQVNLRGQTRACFSDRWWTG